MSLMRQGTDCSDRAGCRSAFPSRVVGLGGFGREFQGGSLCIPGLRRCGVCHSRSLGPHLSFWCLKMGTGHSRKTGHVARGGFKPPT